MMITDGCTDPSVKASNKGTVLLLLPSLRMSMGTETKGPSPIFKQIYVKYN